MVYRCLSFFRAFALSLGAAGAVLLFACCAVPSDPVFGQETPAAQVPVSDPDASAVSSEDSPAAPAVSSEDSIIPDSAASEADSEYEGMDETEPLMETEAVYEIPVGLTDNLRKDTPVGRVARMTQGECDAFVKRIFQANSAGELWKRHENVSAAFRLFETESQTWKEYSCFYADRALYYSDDWTPGLEELRLLIRGENDCVEDYTRSMHFVRFLNASGQPYRDPLTDPVTLNEDTSDEQLLMLHESEDTLFAVTQLTEPSIAGLGLDGVDAPSFYSCTYLLDPGTLELRMLQITLHEASAPAQAPSGGTANNTSDSAANNTSENAAVSYSVTDLRNITYSYDLGMTPFVEAGYRGLLRHMEPEKVWDEKDLRTVTLTLNPGAVEEQVRSISVLKGDPAAFTLPDGYTLFADEALTIPWVDNGDYASDLFLWAAAKDGERNG